MNSVKDYVVFFLFIVVFLYNGIVHRNPKEEAISILSNTDNSHTHNA